MLEISTQVETKDTHYHVYTQCGDQGGIVTSVIVEYKKMKEIKTQPRILTNPKRSNLESQEWQLRKQTRKEESRLIVSVWAPTTWYSNQRKNLR